MGLRRESEVVVSFSKSDIEIFKALNHEMRF